MIRFLDLDDFTKGLKPVSSTNYTTKTGEFDTQGLFSELIFGTVGSLDRKTKFSYINLNALVVHPTALKLLIQLNRKVEKFISTEDSFILDKDGSLLEDNKGATGITAFIKLFPKIKWRGESGERDKIVQLLEHAYKNNRLFVNKLPVIPVDDRPIFQNEVTKEWTVDNLNEYYVKIIRQSLSMRSSGGKGPLYDLLNYGLQKSVINHDEYIRAKVGKKSGIIRSQLMGKRIEFSGRAVITGGPELKVNEIGIPFKLAVSLFYPFIMHELLYTNKFDKKQLGEEIKSYIGTDLSVSSIQKVLKNITKGDEIPEGLYKIIYQATDNSMVNRVVLAKRDPVLHPESVRGFRPVLIEGNTIKLSTLMVGGFNADFDGDQMAIFHPLSKEAQEEVRTKMIRGVGGTNSSSLTFELSKEMCVGLYILSKNIESKKPPIKPTPEDLIKATDPYVPAMFKNRHTTMGKAIINSCFPDDFRFVDSLITKKVANGLLLEIINKYGQEIAYKSATKLKDYGFKFATIMAPNMSIDDIQMPPKMYVLKAKLEKSSTEEAIPILEEMKKLMIETLEGSGLSDLTESGATKGWDQPFQMLCAKGIIADPEGNILPIIKGSFGDGLTVEEYFNATAGARKGIIDRVLNTSDTGYTSRQLIYLLNSVELDWHLKDCKTTNYLELKLTDDLIRRLTGRYVIIRNNLELFDKSKFKSGDIIKLRSPIFCKSLKLCHTCYGKLLERLKSPYVGVIAAQVVGERGTQLTMRSIHVGGVVKVGVKKILSDILENDPYIKKEELEKNIDQVDSNLVSLKKCKMILSLEDYDIGDNLSINEEDGFIWVKSLISIMEFENGEKFNIILDYNVEISMVSEVINDKKTITIFFGENDKILEVPLTQEDIKAQVLYLGRLLGGRELFKDVNHLFMKLYKIYGALPGDMDLVHLEVLLSQCLRDKTNPMYPARVGKDPYNPVLVNIKTNVFSTSFVQGLCFENVGKAIKTGLLEDKSMPPSILEKVLTGTLVEKEKKD